MARDRRRSRCSSLAFLGVNRHYRRFARRLRAGASAVQRRGRADERGAALGRRDRRRDRGRALVRAARSRRTAQLRALHTPGRAHAIRASGPLVGLRRGGAAARDASPGRGPHARVARGGVAAAARRDPTSSPSSSPSSFDAPSLLSAAGATSFRLKLRLLSEPGVVVADVPAVTQARAARRRTPERLVVRVLLADVHGGVAARAQLRPVARGRGHAGGHRSRSTPRRRRVRERVAASRAVDRRSTSATRPTATSARRCSPTSGS